MEFQEKSRRFPGGSHPVLSQGSLFLKLLRIDIQFFNCFPVTPAELFPCGVLSSLIISVHALLEHIIYIPKITSPESSPVLYGSKTRCFELAVVDGHVHLMVNVRCGGKGYLKP